MPTMKTKTRSGRGRQLAVVIHRYVGLAMAVFLMMAGLTGSLLAFNHELDAALNPELMRVTPPADDAERLDPFELRQRIEPHLPDGFRLRTVNFEHREGEALHFWSQGPDDAWREFFADPYTGAVLGSREWGNLAEGKRNLIPFVYRLHYSLGLGEVGTMLFGLVALLWTLDCFVGMYLTFPAGGSSRVATGGSKRSWFRRWAGAWSLRTRKLFSFVFSWHRASGLWVWALLLVFAWSAVGLNLAPVYRPVMRLVTGMGESVHDGLPELERPYPDAKITMQEAHVIGRRHMAEQAKSRGFEVERELWLIYAADHGAFVYSVESSLDISTMRPRTQVYFDGADGHFVGFEAPTGMDAGQTITSWLFNLHFGSVWGLAYRWVVFAMGVLVTGLSVTGVWIWWRKRTKRRGGQRRPRLSRMMSRARRESLGQNAPGRARR